MPWISETAPEIDEAQLLELLDRTLSEARQRICRQPSKVLLLPPDITRMHSGAGRITEHLYHRLSDEADVHVIPTLGQHVPHTPQENRQMFGSIPDEKIHAHDWREGCRTIGEVPAEYVREVSGGAADWPLPIVLSRMLLDEPWDLIINVGHVVPHEVLGFANHNKNYFIGLGGKPLICASHMMAASCGIENNLGNLVTPVRRCFNRAENELLEHLPDLYIQVVMGREPGGKLVHTGYHAGDDIDTYLAAARQSREQNITLFDEPVAKIVCVMQGDEFFSTWVANKAIYRTRMALADGGELVILAPGLKRFGEQDDVDRLIRKYGYVNSERILAQYRENADLQDLAHAAAHLMHGTSEGRFTVTYAPGQLSREEIESVNYQYADLEQLWSHYQPENRREGWHRLDSGEKFYFIPTPSAGLWSTREKLYNRSSGFGDD
ncbi:MAG: lactate racemase domain-containing protein [Pirellulales bacterium]